MITNGYGNTDIRRLLGQTVRDCDQFYVLTDESAILMPCTSQNEACIAVNRYKKTCDDAVNLTFSIVSYPSDATTPKTMLEAAKQLTLKARRSRPSAVMKEEQ